MEPTGTTSNVRVTRYREDGVKPPGPTVVRLVHGPMTPEDLEKASLMTKAQRLRKELVVWAKGGMKLVPTAVRKARLAVCEACEYYDPKGNWGLGACNAPGCGCSRVKAALATSRCPKGKWAA